MATTALRPIASQGMTGSQPPALSDSLVRALVQLHRYTVDISDIADQMLGGHDLENRDIQMVMLLHRMGSMNPTALGVHTGAPRSTVARGLNRLESAGLVTRRADTRDRRRALIVLTPKGRRRVAGFAARLGDYFSVGEPLLKDAFHALDTDIPDADPGSVTDPVAAAEALSSVGAAYSAEVRGAVAPFGGSEVSDRFTLALIRLYGVQRPTQISAEIRLTPSATSAVLSRLERGGLITRRHDITPGDRRAVVVELTRRGEQAIGAELAVFARHVPQLTRALGLTWATAD